jgi:hypothetical protein
MRHEVSALPSLCEVLTQAVESGDEVALATALAARAEAFALLQQAGPDPGEREILKWVAREDQRILALAREAQEVLRAELSELRQLRAATRRVPRSEPDSLLFSRRV